MYRTDYWKRVKRSLEKVLEEVVGFDWREGDDREEEAEEEEEEDGVGDGSSVEDEDVVGLITSRRRGGGSRSERRGGKKVELIGKNEERKSKRKRREIRLVVLGLGSFEETFQSRYQLCLAILLKDILRQKDSNKETYVYDPWMSSDDHHLVENFGFKVGDNSSSGDNYGQCYYVKPNEAAVVFFAPHLYRELYNDILKFNWNSDSLKRVVIFGNSFNDMVFTEERQHYDVMGWIRKSVNSEICKEMRINVENERRGNGREGEVSWRDDHLPSEAFSGLSMHYFEMNQEDEMADDDTKDIK